MKSCWVLCVLFLQGLNLCLAKIRPDCACGESNIKTSGRIVNGKTVQANKYPWMAAMFNVGAQEISCGGAVISDKNILTAGHCIFYSGDLSKTYWILGMHDQQLRDGTVYNVANVELHPKFTNHTIFDDYDIALVTVVQRIRFTQTVKPICLPTPGEDFTGQVGIVAGWGKLSEGQNAAVGVLLQEVRIRVKQNDECRRETKRLVNFNYESMICGYEFKTDACQGDSGGPFFIETEPNRYEVFGVVSFGDGCAKKFPGIYGKITDPSTIRWIHNYIYQTRADICLDPAGEAARNGRVGILDELANLLTI